MTSEVPAILEALFECTLEMINKNLEEFPEHRINFFRLLQSITAHCFEGKETVTVREVLLVATNCSSVCFAPTAHTILVLLTAF